jgi:cytochrome c oxidase subunit II
MPSTEVAAAQAEQPRRPARPVGRGRRAGGAGRDIFLNQATCGVCHAIQGTVAQGDVGPNLTQFGLRTSLAAGILENTPENLAAWIIDPERFKPGVEHAGDRRTPWAAHRGRFPLRMAGHRISTTSRCGQCPRTC